MHWVRRDLKVRRARRARPARWVRRDLKVRRAHKVRPARWVRRVSQGTQGTTGALGPQGTQGSQGTQGTTGAFGPQGSQGSQGTTGALGPQGSQGSQGTQGTTGALGPQGSQGAQGTQGITGSSGATAAVPFTTVTTTPYAFTGAEYVVLCNAAGTGAPGIQLTLPAVASFPGRIFRVKRINQNNATQDRCYVSPVGTPTGTTTVTLDAPDATATNINSSMTFMSDGTKWWVISAGP